MKPQATPEELSAHLEFLKLPVMRQRLSLHAQRAIDEGLTPLEFLAGLLEEEVSEKQERAVRSRVLAARLPSIKTMDGWDWKWNASSIRREQLLPLFDLEFVGKKENLLFVGKQGVGKSRIASSLAYTACTRGVRTLFTTSADMVNRLLAAAATHTLQKSIQIYSRPELLVLDEVGYLPFSKEAGDLFFQVVSSRYEQGSIVLTTNRAFKNWNEIFADPIVATAIIERLVHHSQIFTFNGKSYRLKGKGQLTCADEPTE